jgi:hypothetical protein
MDTEYRSHLVAHLLALKDAPDTTLLDRVQTPHAVRRDGLALGKIL